VANRRGVSKIHQMIGDIQSGRQPRPSSILLSLVCKSFFSLEVNGPKWEKLVSLWQGANSKVLGKKAATSLKGNLEQAITRGGMSWSIWYRFIQTMNAEHRFKRIRFTVTFTDRQDNDISVWTDLVDREVGLGDVGLSEGTLNPDVKVLNPGTTVVPGTVYFVTDFKDSKLNGLSLKYTGNHPVEVLDGDLTGLSRVGSIIMTASGNIDNNWSVEKNADGVDNE